MRKKEGIDKRQFVSFNLKTLPKYAHKIWLDKQKELNDSCDFCTYNMEKTMIKILRKIENIDLTK